ncbi:hypothetical protein ECG_07357 [Echinococcus granulosus]|uniref:Expressed conserved protein n=1 Tax=Echinococcus granulosus TaxID=6210 RepID=A0A068WPJ7_ECHGR|nr:hypothetical protein ECG_07357 [Echinococcus granulosus]CDS22049.1 expressed conserved protein [Echinococcus granulosus]
MLHQQPSAVIATMRPGNSRPGGFYPGQSLMGPFTPQTPRQPFSGTARPLSTVLSPLTFSHSSKRLPCGLMDFFALRGMPNQLGGSCDAAKPSATQDVKPF